MSWVFIAVGAVAVVVIGLVVVGRVTAELADRPGASVYDQDEAVAYVAERLPPEVTAELSYADVDAVLTAHLNYLEMKGVAGDPAVAPLAQGPLVAEENEGLAWVLGRLSEEGRALTDEHVVEVLDAELEYLRFIGAVGTEVAPPPDPTL
ncbi:MAG: hypothetical protein JJU45_05650 [Acidimicrobiia bacterium]|nr:hypothetical protein [Acidimicrobiia bacterium]